MVELSGCDGEKGKGEGADKFSNVEPGFSVGDFGGSFVEDEPGGKWERLERS